MNTSKIYIVLTDTGTIFTRLIKLYTKKPLNHASIAFDEELKELYSFGRKHQRIAFIGGFVKENIYNRLFRKAKCAVFSYTVSETQIHQLKKHIESMKQNRENYKYNFIGLFGVMLNKEIERRNAFFCSQFVATLLKESGVSIIDKPPALVTPQDFQKAPELNLEYEGDMCLYPYAKRDVELKPALPFLAGKRATRKDHIAAAFHKAKALI